MRQFTNEINKISYRKNSKEIIEDTIRSNKSQFCVTSRRLASFYEGNRDPLPNDTIV